MTILIAILAIWGLTLMAWLFKRRFLKPSSWINKYFCSICIGVAGTWLMALIAYAANYLKSDEWRLMIAVMMGGSAVGFPMYFERFLPQNRSALTWKTLFIPIAFGVMAGLLTEQWLWVVGGLIWLIGLGLIFFISNQSKIPSARAKNIEEQLKDCC